VITQRIPHKKRKSTMGERAKKNVRIFCGTAVLLVLLILATGATTNNGALIAWLILNSLGLVATVFIPTKE